MPNDERETPQWLFNKLNEVFHFQVDLAATAANTKCLNYFTKKDDALNQTWNPYYWQWCNPPCSRGQLPKWALKATESQTRVVMLLPGDTSTWVFHYLHNVARIFFLHGRLKFGTDGPAKFGSILGVWKSAEAERVAVSQRVGGWWA